MAGDTGWSSSYFRSRPTTSKVVLRGSAPARALFAGRASDLWWSLPPRSLVSCTCIDGSGTRSWPAVASGLSFVRAAPSPAPRGSAGSEISSPAQKSGSWRTALGVFFSSRRSCPCCAFRYPLVDNFAAWRFPVWRCALALELRAGKNAVFFIGNRTCKLLTDAVKRYLILTCYEGGAVLEIITGNLHVRAACASRETTRIQSPGSESTLRPQQVEVSSNKGQTKQILSVRHNIQHHNDSSVRVIVCWVQVHLTTVYVSALSGWEASWGSDTFVSKPRLMTPLSLTASCGGCPQAGNRYCH